MTALFASLLALLSDAGDARTRMLRQRELERRLAQGGMANPNVPHWQRTLHPDWQAYLTQLSGRLGSDEATYVTAMWPRARVRELYSLLEMMGQSGLPTVTLLLAQVQALRSQNPLWVLDEPTAEALLRTDLPAEELADLPKLPYKGFYLKVPPLFTIEDPQSGAHEVEGLWFAEDAIARTLDGHVAQPLLTKPDSRVVVHPAITIVAVGKAKGLRKSPVMGIRDIDDTLRFFRIWVGMPLGDLAKEADNASILRLGLNLLWALHAGYLTTTKRAPTRNPKSEVKRRRLERQGESLRIWTEVKLSPRALAAQQTEPGAVPPPARGPTSSSERAAPPPTFVRGHWQGYWVRDPKGEAPFSTPRTRADGQTLHLVRRWKPPYWKRGEGVPRPPRAKVRFGFAPTEGP